MAGPWQHADVNEEKAANRVLLRWTEGSRDGVAYRDMAAMHPADSTDGRAAVSPACRQAFWLVSSGPAKDALLCHFAALGITCQGEVGGAKGCRTCGIYFQVGRLRTNSKVRAALGARARRARYVCSLRRACAGGRLRRGSQGGKRRGWGAGGAAHPLQSGRKSPRISGLGRLGILRAAAGPLG